MPTLPTFSAFLAFNVALIIFVVSWQVRKRRRDAHLPPSPPSDPIIGHYRTFPRTYQAEVFFEWSTLR